MNYSHITHCPNCFCASPSPICPHCDFDRDKYINENKANHHLPLFTKLNKGYVIGRVLGEGSFAIVYAALREQDNLLFAVKEYFPESLASRNGCTVQPKRSEIERLDVWEKRFKQEAELLKQCCQDSLPITGIVKFVDLIQQHNTAYLVMERLIGQPLGYYLQPIGKTLAARDVCLWLKPLLETLQKLHAKTVWHRDISPNNIFLCSSNKPVLMDFGLARIGERETLLLSTTLGVGTFIAPEQLNGGRCDQRTDLYSLGAVIYLCLHGQAPPSVDARRQGVELERLEQTDKISSALQKIALLCLQLDINKRPTNAEMLLNYLATFWVSEDSVATLPKEKTSSAPPPENKNQERIVPDFQPNNINLDSSNQQTIIQGVSDSANQPKEVSQPVVSEESQPDKKPPPENRISTAQQSEPQKKSFPSFKLLFLILPLFYIVLNFEELKSKLIPQSPQEMQKVDVVNEKVNIFKPKTAKKQSKKPNESERAIVEKPIQEPIEKPAEENKIEEVKGQPTLYVKPEKLNLRSGAGVKGYKKIATINQNDAVTLLAITTNSDGEVWAKVRAGSYEGWVNKKLLSETKTDISQKETGEITIAAIKNLSYSILYSGEKVKLIKGEWFRAYPDSPSGVGESLSIYDNQVEFGDLDGDGDKDAAVIFVYNGGGSGSFAEVAAILNQGNHIEHVASRLLGDRVEIQSFFISDGNITIKLSNSRFYPGKNATLKYQLSGNKLIGQESPFQ